MKILLLLCFLQAAYTQVRDSHPSLPKYTLRTIAFYNLENLYDTIDDPDTADDEHTPAGSYQWDSKRYSQKLKYLAQTIGKIGAVRSGRPPHLLGVCEVENRTVIEDLINTAPLDFIDYGIVHHDSPDERGIDVALVYDRTVFIPVDFNHHTLYIFTKENYRDRTRDQLVVSGYLDRDFIYLLINHWPSRSGGTARSEPYRKAAARLNLDIIDSIRRVDNEAKLVIMGDFNDNPTNSSLAKIIRAGPGQSGDEEFYNPMFRMYQLGFGTLAYRDRWNLFDQIILSANFRAPNSERYRFWKAGVHNSGELLTRKGKYEGYPWRTYAGGRYTGGVSDHFPVYIYLLRSPEE